MYIKISSDYYVIYIIFAFSSKKPLKKIKIYAIMTKYSNLKSPRRLREESV